MIVINSDLILKNQTDFDKYVELLREQVYDDFSKLTVECVIEFLEDVWSRDAKLTAKVQEQIDEDLYPMVYVDIFNSADFKAVTFGAASTNEDYKMKKKQKIAFKRYCDKYFKTMISLFDRFCNL